MCVLISSSLNVINLKHLMEIFHGVGLRILTDGILMARNLVKTSQKNLQIK